MNEVDPPDSSPVRSAGRLLVVDEDPTYRDVLDMRLAGWGYEVRVASGAVEAAFIARGWTPDLILADLDTLDVRGLEFVERVQERTNLCPLLFLTAFGRTDLAIEALTLDSAALLMKPLDYASLRAAVEQALSSGGKVPALNSEE